MTIDNGLACLSHSRKPAIKKPMLFIEVQITENASKDPLVHNEEIRQEIRKWFESSFIQVKVAQQLDTSGSSLQIPSIFYRLSSCY
jgi:hypothetical protein